MYFSLKLSIYVTSIGFLIGSSICHPVEDSLEVSPGSSEDTLSSVGHPETVDIIPETATEKQEIEEEEGIVDEVSEDTDDNEEVVDLEYGVTEKTSLATRLKNHFSNTKTKRNALFEGEVVCTCKRTNNQNIHSSNQEFIANNVFRESGDSVSETIANTFDSNTNIGLDTSSNFDSHTLDANTNIILDTNENSNTNIELLDTNSNVDSHTLDANTNIILDTNENSNIILDTNENSNTNIGSDLDSNTLDANTNIISDNSENSNSFDGQTNIILDTNQNSNSFDSNINTGYDVIDTSANVEPNTHGTDLITSDNIIPNLSVNCPEDELNSQGGILGSNDQTLLNGVAEEGSTGTVVDGDNIQGQIISNGETLDQSSNSQMDNFQEELNVGSVDQTASNVATLEGDSTGAVENSFDGNSEGIVQGENDQQTLSIDEAEQTGVSY